MDMLILHHVSNTCNLQRNLKNRSKQEPGIWSRVGWYLQCILLSAWKQCVVSYRWFLHTKYISTLLRDTLKRCCIHINLSWMMTLMSLFDLQGLENLGVAIEWFNTAICWLGKRSHKIFNPASKELSVILHHFHCNNINVEVKMLSLGGQRLSLESSQSSFLTNGFFQQQLSTL